MGCTVHGCAQGPPDEPDLTITADQATQANPIGVPPLLATSRYGGSAPYPVGNLPIQPSSMTVQPPPPDHHPGNYLLPLSIVSTLFCCTAFYFGIVAIYFSAQVENCMREGNLYGAHNAARKARLWCWITFGVGLPLNLVAVIVMSLD